MPGRDSERQPCTSFHSGKADSPGYTQEQAAEVRRFQAELLRLGFVHFKRQRLSVSFDSSC
ncbi:hypothetical protein ACFU6I_18740 [Streptomyces sp. NPDC057486]|uniref:hypothetical protein n=1 Tax=Streptomyces sp. NPDC057486 TaxID=3346145 RepID=UPI0036A5D965